MVNSVQGDVLKLKSLYSLNVVEYLNFLSYNKDKQTFQEHKEL